MLKKHSMWNGRGKGASQAGRNRKDNGKQTHWEPTQRRLRQVSARLQGVASTRFFRALFVTSSLWPGCDNTEAFTSKAVTHQKIALRDKAAAADPSNEEPSSP